MTFLSPFKQFVKKIIRKINILPTPKVINVPLLLQQRFCQTIEENHSEKVAVFFDLENLEKSAIALYSVNTFCPYSNLFHVFTSFSSSRNADKILKLIEQMIDLPRKQIRLFCSGDFHEMDKTFHYGACIFVLGNSAYNLHTFNEAVRLYENRKRHYLYLHDGICTNLLHAWLNHHRVSWKNFLDFYYRDFIQGITSFTTENLFRKGIYSLSPVIELTGCMNIIVNAENCKPLIEKDLRDISNIKVYKAFLPLPDSSDVLADDIFKEDIFTIAHFGIPHEFKQLDKLIQAVEIISRIPRQNLKIKLLLAGYGVKKYAKNFSASQKRLIHMIESPSSERMLSLMKGACVTVQLRWPFGGQSSGVVAEMLSLGKKCITTKGFVNESLKDYVIEVPHDITPRLLADVISAHRGKINFSAIEHRLILNKFSFGALAKLLHETGTNKENLRECYAK